MPVTFTRSALMLGLLLGLGQAHALETPSPKALATQQGIPHPAVIAHRGASFDAPESTAAAYKLARDLGADYLELDLQRSKDGVLFVLHDDNLLRTTDVATKFPERKDSSANAFTMAELKTLDAEQLVQRGLSGPCSAFLCGLEDPDAGRGDQHRRGQPPAETRAVHRD